MHYSLPLVCFYLLFSKAFPFRANLLFEWNLKNTSYCGQYSLLSRMLNLARIDINLSTFKVNNFYYVINYLNANRVTIYKAKCLGMVTLRVLPTTCFRYSSEEKSSKFPIPSVKLNWIDWYEFFCSRKWQALKNLLYLSRKVCTFIPILRKMFLLWHCLIVLWWLQMKILLLEFVSNKKTESDICSNLAYLVHVWNISNIACHK